MTAPVTSTNKIDADMTTKAEYVVLMHKFFGISDPEEYLDINRDIKKNINHKEQVGVVPDFSVLSVDVYFILHLNSL